MCLGKEGERREGGREEKDREIWKDGGREGEGKEGERDGACQREDRRERKRG